MKNIISIAFLFTLLVSGCGQEEMQTNEASASGGRIFTTAFEQNESRTYVEDGRFTRWTKGDRISLFDGNTLNRQYKFDGKTGDTGGTFSTMVDKEYGTGNLLSTNYAVYPYRSDMKIKENGVIITTLPAQQSYEWNSYGREDNTMVAVTHNVYDTFLKFKNVGGCIKLQLYGDDVRVSSITLTGNNNEKIAGKATITAAYDKEPVVSMADDATTSITLDCYERIGYSAEDATAFWFVLPPVTFEKGFTVKVKGIGNNAFTLSTDKKVTVERNVVKPMAAVEVKIEKPNMDLLKDALVKLYESTNGDNWTNNENWCSDQPIGEWYGVSVSEYSGYVNLDLGENNLTGKIEQAFPDDMYIRLRCNNNEIASINLSGSTSLEELDCNGNPLETLDVSGCTALRGIHFQAYHYNDIRTLTTLNASGCTSLETLYCDNNKLTTLNVDGCKTLRFLRCNDNQLTNLNVSNQTSLEELDCNGNPLETLDVSGCTALREIHFQAYHYNDIRTLTTLNASGCTSLETLYCDNNKLTTLNVEGCKALRSLNCGDNQLTSVIPDWFSQLEGFDYDVRYEYWEDYVDGEPVIRYKDNGVGWWYPGEPEKGYHGRD